MTIKLLTLQNECKLAVRLNHDIKLLLLEEISYIMAVDVYSQFVLACGDEFIVTCTLKSIEQLLTPLNFVRCHKGYMVNINHIQELHNGCSPNLTLTGNKDVPVSRSGLKRVKEVMGL
jgi:DNA-binding LytR/AlgR family response regulator